MKQMKKFQTTKVNGPAFLSTSCISCRFHGKFCLHWCRQPVQHIFLDRILKYESDINLTYVPLNKKNSTLQWSE